MSHAPTPVIIFYFSTPTGAEDGEEPAAGVLGPSKVFPLYFFPPPSLKPGKIKAAELSPRGSDAGREAEASGSVPSAVFSVLPQRAALCRGAAHPGCSQEALNGSIIPGAAPLAQPRGSRSSAGTAGTPRARAGLAQGTELPRQGTQGSKVPVGKEGEGAGAALLAPHPSGVRSQPAAVRILG